MDGVDEDEFLENQLVYQYPVDVITGAEQMLHRLQDKIQRQAFPFDGFLKVGWTDYGTTVTPRHCHEACYHPFCFDLHSAASRRISAAIEELTG